MLRKSLLVVASSSAEAKHMTLLAKRVIRSYDIIFLYMGNARSSNQLYTACGDSLDAFRRILIYDLETRSFIHQKKSLGHHEAMLQAFSIRSRVGSEVERLRISLFLDKCKSLSSSIGSEVNSFLQNYYRGYIRRSVRSVFAFRLKLLEAYGQLVRLVRIFILKRIEHKSLSGMDMMRFVLYSRILKSVQDTYSSIFLRYRFDAVLIPDDVPGLIWPPLVRHAKSMHVPVVISPFTVYDEHESLSSLVDNIQFKCDKSPEELGVPWTWFSQSIDSGSKKFLRLPHAMICALLQNGYDIENPWRLGACGPDYIVSTGLFMYGYYSKRLNKAFTHFHETSTYQSIDGPYVVIAGCPNQYSTQYPSSEFEDIAAFEESFARLLVSKKSSMIFQIFPHPNYPDFMKKWRSMLENAGHILSPDRELEAAVAESRFVVGFASATLRWAIDYDKPGINYDLFRYRYSDYSDYKQIHEVDNLTDFGLKLDELNCANKLLTRKEGARVAPRGETLCDILDDLT